RDALFLLLQKGVEEESVLEFLALPAADVPDLVELALRERAGVGVETAEQRRLAVVHVADDDDVQMLGGGRRAKGGGRHGRITCNHLYGGAPSRGLHPAPGPSARLRWCFGP